MPPLGAPASGWPGGNTLIWLASPKEMISVERGIRDSFIGGRRGSTKSGEKMKVPVLTAYVLEKSSASGTRSDGQW